MAYLHAQKLNRRVTIERKVVVQNTWGQAADVWVEYCRLWAHVRMVNGAGFVSSEMEAGGTEVSRTVASIRVRKTTGLQAGMRVRLGDAIYDIRAVLPDEQDRRYVDLGVAIGASEG